MVWNFVSIPTGPQKVNSKDDGVRRWETIHLGDD